MLDIDFLPDQYHRRRARHQSKPWLVMVALAFGCLVALAGGGQYRVYCRLLAECAQLETPYEQALGQKAQLDALQRELQTVRAEAALLTYLRHPWPRTQLLHAVLKAFPDRIALTRLEITADIPTAKASKRPRSPAFAPTDEAPAQNPAESDLTNLRDRTDSMETVVRLSGTTKDSGALHPYLGALASNPLFRKAELEAIESSETGTTDTMRFEATLIVQRGYGQPGGPSEPPQEALAARPNP